MKLARMLVVEYIVFAAIVGGSLRLMSPTAAQAQSTGNNAVWGTGSSPVGSYAFIDASASSTTAHDICVTLYNIISSSSYLTNYPSGAVIDARGISAANSYSVSGNMTCAGSPWVNGSNTTTNPATILLPAGYSPSSGETGNIIISQTWVLPNGSKIIGEGPNPKQDATLQAISGFTGPMIEMGNSSSVCPTVGSSYVCTGVAVRMPVNS